MKIEINEKIAVGKKSVGRHLGSSNYVRWCILLSVTIIFSIVLFPSLVIKKHVYQLEDVATKDIKAVKDFLIEDKVATAAKRNEAVKNVLTVYDYDDALAERLSRRINLAFEDLRTIIKADTAGQDQNSSDQSESSSKAVNNKIRLNDLIWQKKDDFEKNLGIDVSEGAYKILVNEAFDENISNLIIKILSAILNNGVVSNKELLLKESDKGICLKTVNTKTETVVHNLKRFYSLDQAKTMVRIVAQPMLKNINYTLINLIVDFVQSMIQPNITLNRSETEERKKIAASEIKPILYKIKTGEMLIREGERVTDVQLLKLKALQKQSQNERIISKSLGSAMIILSILIIVYTLNFKGKGNINNKNLIFIAIVLIIFILIAAISSSLSVTFTQNTDYYLSASSIIYGIPIASGAMVVCLFMGLDIAIAFSMVIAICVAVIFNSRLEILIYFLLNSAMGAYWIQNCRERKVFIKAGLKIGLANIAFASAINIFLSSFAGVGFLWDISFAFLGGIVAGIVTAGIAPLVEIAFDYTTDIKLLELANLDKPILKKLMIEAPGTYHHSMIVGSLAEAAAAEIGVNPLSAKVCGYYHDIGKIKKPFYFIENQMDGKNKHDKLAPSMSSLILVSHIKDGVEIAKKNKLGQIIVDTIMQHHGTSTIKYFYQKAIKNKGPDAVNIENYKYPGPKPQTKEAGLVMLADSVEAASRTLDNPTSARIQGLVQNLINNIFSDGQLDDCEFTLKDLHKIAKSFNKILNGIHHHRIEYEETFDSKNGKANNGSSDKQPTDQAQNISGKDTETSPGHLKRLGLS